MRYALMVVLYVFLSVIASDGQERPEEKKKEVTASDVRRETKEAADTAQGYLQQKKERYLKKAGDRLHRIETKAKQLYDKAEEKGGRAKDKISSSAEELSRKGDKAKEKLKEIRASGERKWQKAKTELDSLIRDLERSYDRMAEKFGSDKQEGAGR